MEESFGFPAVNLPNEASSPADAIKYLVGQLIERRQLPPINATNVIRQFLHRETLGSTGIGTAVAIPHIVSDLVDRFVGIIGRSQTGILWPGAADDSPVRLVCVFVTPAAHPGEHAKALEKLAKRLRSLQDDESNW